ncbi:hypothetical protein [Methylobacterium sp. ID0610]|uniref:hypothetical protein n=1 Tax=Methylobacterium carpenticola TaxID=3344827 RepID=UPI00369CAB1F
MSASMRIFRQQLFLTVLTIASMLPVCGEVKGLERGWEKRGPVLLYEMNRDASEKAMVQAGPSFSPDNGECFRAAGTFRFDEYGLRMNFDPHKWKVNVNLNRGTEDNSVALTFFNENCRMRLSSPNPI